MSNPATAQPAPPVPPAEDGGLSTGDADRYLSPADAAQFLGLAKNTLAKWRMTGEGPRFFAPRPGVIRYLLSDLHAFMREGEGGGDAVRG